MRFMSRRCFREMIAKADTVGFMKVGEESQDLVYNKAMKKMIEITDKDMIGFRILKRTFTFYCKECDYLFTIKNKND